MKHVDPWTILNIAETEYRALIAVRDKLASGEYQDNMATEGNSFDMCVVNCPLYRAWDTPDEGARCGTAACIGGWMGIEMGMNASTHADLMDTEAFNDLFYPNIAAWDDIKPEHAVKAIDNFLATGKPKWGEVMGRCENGRCGRIIDE